ncbi:alpha/beta fold hydrolase [Clostridium estertheticum]|uniref:prolyl aminopeptidase n=1 Tax=Clostridium estertheticum TaxID=238834 RepID=A0A7Y3SZW1_9CLOT|nr:alpha/beta fold hydrolase [Clostridium estertheticum]NNU78455.1 alpha/beta fold hydrolase [Clostridium estertheticum]WBL49441.1 alpha/beta hydrolase [Clostridium estertheticum]
MKKHKIITSFKRGLAGKVGKIMLISFSLITLCITALAIILLVQSPGKVNPLRDKNGNVMKDSISEKINVKINGVNMGMIIKSENISNPVLLFVHGGPGMPEYFLTETYPTGLEKYFTLVWWDQRGAGLSYSSDISAKTMTTNQFVSDTISVTNYLREHFGQDKLYLMGHSWGSYIALQAAAKSPELYHAYIGVGQTSNQMESEKIAYKYMIKYYNAKGDKKTVKKLEATPIETMDSLSDAYKKIRDDLMHRAGIGTTHKGVRQPFM